MVNPFAKGSGRLLTVLQQQIFNSVTVTRHPLQESQLSQCPHSLPDDKPAANLWPCATSLFSLNCSYELSNPAFLTTSALLPELQVPRALYLRATQRNDTATDI